jgi:malonyl CoA-acyl carrier protein transacylase
MIPGQGSQFKGMGETLFDLYANETKEASQLLGYDIMDLCLNDPNNNLNNTEYTQPAIYFVSCLGSMCPKVRSVPFGLRERL